MEEPALNGALPYEDYAPVKNLKEARSVLRTETVKMWKIAGPVVLNLLCLYGTNSFTNIFVGHIGEIELSSATISLSVIGTFSFGLLVSSLIFPSPKNGIFHLLCYVMLCFFLFCSVALCKISLAWEALWRRFAVKLLEEGMFTCLVFICNGLG